MKILEQRDRRKPEQVLWCIFSGNCTEEVLDRARLSAL
jgi:hypothetical protein